jgi:hypothetical protein
MTEGAIEPTPRLTRPWLIVAGTMTILLAGTVVLWAHYGATVFFELIAAGLAACL